MGTLCAASTAAKIGMRPVSVGRLIKYDNARIKVIRPIFSFDNKLASLLNWQSNHFYKGDGSDI